MSKELPQKSKPYSGDISLELIKGLYNLIDICKIYVTFMPCHMEKCSI